MHSKNLSGRSTLCRSVFVLFIFFSSAVNLSSAQVLINEIQSSNISTVRDQFGEFDDWIELYNAGNTTINLSGYSLTDDATKPLLFQFPDISLAPQSYLLVFAADTNMTDVNSHWETAVNSNSNWSYRANTSSPPDTNWRNLSFTGNWSSGTGGIGFGDGDDGTLVSTCVSVYSRKTFSIIDTSKIRAAILNVDYDDAFVAYLNGVEIARANIGSPGLRPAWNALASAAHEAAMYQGGNPDSFYLGRNFLMPLLKNGINVLALEVHNQSTTNSDLTCRSWLSFQVTNDVNFFGSVPAFFKTPSNQFLHAGFKLSRTGETVYLLNGDGSIIDQKYSGAIESDNSIGRNPDGSSNWCLFGSPSAGESNNSSSCAAGYTSSPVFSLIGGFYSTGQLLSLSTSYAGGQIRYTIDGTDVSGSSSLYTGAIHIDTTQTIRAAVFAANVLSGPSITNTYFIGEQARLPVFSLTTDPKNLWDYNTGIFVKGPNAGTSNPYWGANFWQDWEKPVTLEYFDRSKNRAFRFNSGMKITGGWSRSAPQKSMEIMLGDRYGQSKLNYALEESVKPWLDKWDDFILHNTGNDRNLCKMRDPLMNRLLKGTHNDYLAYEPCLVFINGQNWGVYYIRENDDHHWIESNYGYKKEEVDLLKESYFYSGIEVKKGSDSAFFAMYEYAMGTSSSDPSFYSSMSSFIDLENMADYFIAETYYPNDDWMGGSNNNLKLWRPRKEGGKFRYLIYDLDFGLGYSGTVTNNMLAIARNASPHNYNSDLFKVLTNNATYKRYFINRYADLMNTIFLPSSIEAMVNLYRDSIKHDMHYQWEAWGGDSANWVSKINSMVTFANQRPANSRNFVQSEFGLSGQVTLTIQAQPAGAGRIQISTITPESLPWTGVYFNGNPVTITAIPNPGYSFDHWKSNVVINQNNYNQSATINFTGNDVITCYFSGSEAPVDISYTEVNYNSSHTSDAGDWIEIKNNAEYRLNLTGWKFRDEDDQHVFEFPVGTVLDAGAYMVLASDLTKFNERFPLVQNVAGDFGFDFSNGGEDLRLFNHKDSLVKSVYYQDQLPWPVAADGQGYTLEIKNSHQNANDGSNWFAGCLGGSPGRPYQAPIVSLSASGSVSFCQGDSLELQASSTSSASFQWKKDNLEISQATFSSVNVDAAGVYQVLVTDNGCSALSDSIRINILPIEQVTSTTSAQRCDAGSVVLSANGTSALKWFATQNGGVELATGSVFITPAISQSTVYYVGASGTCTGPRLSVEAIVLPVHQTPVVHDAERCGPGDITLTASDTASIRWYDSPVGGTMLGKGSDLLISALQQSSVFYAEAGSVCPSSRVEVHAGILEVTANPSGTNMQHCGPGSLMLTVNDTVSIRWYDAATGGNLLETGNTFTTPVISQTTTYYVEAGDICPSERIDFQAVISPISANPIASDVHRCGYGVVSLSVVSTDPVSWYDTIGGTLLSTGNFFNSPTLTESETYFVQAGVNCPSGWVSVQAILDPVASDPVVMNAERCGPGSVTLTETAGTPVSWYDSPGGNLLATGSSFISPILSMDAIYYARAGQDCPSNFVPSFISIHALPIPELGNDTLISSGMQLTLDPGQGFAAYSWSDGSIASTLSIQTGGMFSVTVTDSNSCSASDSIIVLLGTELKSQSLIKGFDLYPNPATTQVSIQLSNIGKSGEIRLIDVSGRILRRNIFNENDSLIHLDVNGLTPGFYQLQYLSEGKLLSKSLIIQ